MFDWLKRLTRGAYYENPANPWTTALLTPPSSSGIAVSRETVLGYPALWRGVNLIASTCARLPLNLYQRQSNDTRRVADNHPSHWLMQRPSNLVGKFLFFQTLIAHVKLKGNGYALIGRDANFQPNSLAILDPEITHPVYETTINADKSVSVQLYYKTGYGNDLIKLLPQEILHFRNLSHDGICGYSILDMLKESLGLGMALQKFGSVYFKHSGRPGTIVSLPGFFKDDEEVTKFRKDWENFHAGLDNAHKTAILQGGATVVSPGLNNEQAQWILAREFEVKSIANIIGVPPHKLGANISTSYNSLEQENKSFLSDLEPMLTMIEEELDNKLLTEVQKNRDSHYFEFKREALERADTRTEIDTLISQVNNGLLTLNQYYALKNMEGIGEEGDKHRMPSNFVLLEDQAKQAQAPPAQPQPNNKIGFQQTPITELNR